jgi:hypothetical protein
MVKGGKAIASGGYGCVFNPALKCKTKNNRTTGVSKLLRTQAANEEFAESIEIKEVVKNIPDIEKYILLPSSKCTPAPLTNDDIQNMSSKCNKFTDAIVNLDKYTIINMPLGGIDLGKYFDDHNVSSNFISINNNLIDLLVNAVSKFNHKNLLHNDLKGGNILVDNDLNCKIIDWGLSFTYSKSDTSIIDSEMEWKPIQYNIPYSNILFSNFYMEQIVHFLKDMKAKDIEVTQNGLAQELSDAYYHYEDIYDKGHMKYVIEMIETIIKIGGYKGNNNKRVRATDIIFNYLSKCVYKFLDKDNLTFDKHSYFYDVYSYNCDIWGILTCYYKFLCLSENRFKFKDQEKVTFIKFRKDVADLLLKHMILCDNKPIKLDSLTKDLQKLNHYFPDAHASVKMRSLNQKTPTTNTKKTNSNGSEGEIGTKRSKSKSAKHKSVRSKLSKRKSIRSKSSKRKSIRSKSSKRISSE